jgi:hypothetical protein
VSESNKRAEESQESFTSSHQKTHQNHRQVSGEDFCSGSNSDFGYNLHRLFNNEADPTARAQAAHAIQIGTRQSIASLSDDLFPTFLQLHQETADDALRSEIAKILGYLWIQRMYQQRQLVSGSKPFGSVWVTLLNLLWIRASKQLSQMHTNFLVGMTVCKKRT